VHGFLGQQQQEGGADVAAIAATRSTPATAATATAFTVAATAGSGFRPLVPGATAGTAVTLTVRIAVRAAGALGSAARTTSSSTAGPRRILEGILGRSATGEVVVLTSASAPIERAVPAVEGAAGLCVVMMLSHGAILSLFVS
jgi:hypothetical protein